MTGILALVIVLIAMSLGDIISIKTKAFVPSVFITALIFLFGFWWIFPKDVISKATLGMPVAGLAMYLLVTHMGTLMNVRELASQWRTVVISIAGILGIMALLLTVGLIFLDKQTAIAGGPPLSGGIVAAIIIKEAATSLGNDKLAILAILIYVVQGFVGYPLTSILLRKEGNRLIKIFRNGKENKTTVSLKDQKGNTSLRSKADLSVSEKIGGEFEVLSDRVKVSYGLNSGVIAKNIVDGGELSKIGVVDNYIIMEINGKPVNSQKDIENILKNYKGTVSVVYLDEYGRITRKGFIMP